MQAEAFVSRVLDDEGLIDGLDEPEAQRLVAWLVKRVEDIAAKASKEADAWKRIEELCRRGRAIGQLVALHCYEHDAGAAAVLAKEQKLPWPLPAEPQQALQHILNQEGT